MEATASTPGPIGVARSRRTAFAARLSRGVSASVLVLSIGPVLLLGQSLLRAPLKLERETHAGIERLFAHPHASTRQHTRHDPARGGAPSVRLQVLGPARGTP